MRPSQTPDLPCGADDIARACCLGFPSPSTAARKMHLIFVLCSERYSSSLDFITTGVHPAAELRSPRLGVRNSILCCRNPSLCWRTLFQAAAITSATRFSILEKKGESVVFSLIVSLSCLYWYASRRSRVAKTSQHLNRVRTPLLPIAYQFSTFSRPPYRD